MKIRNLTTKKDITETTEIARSSLRKALGLMFRSGLKRGHGLLMEFTKPSKYAYSIWMLGMRFPIDIIFIGPDKKVTDVFENVPPLSFRPSTWRVYSPTKPVKWIVEVSAGMARKSGTSVGDRLIFD